MNRAQRVVLAAALLMPVSATWVQGDTEQTPIALPPPAPVTVDFREHILPILESKCFACHGPRQQEAGLRLDLRQNAMRGGAYGPVIVPGKSAESKLILRVSGPTAGLQMPPTGALEAEEIGLLRAWIDQGAEMPGRAIDPELAPSATHPNVKAFFDTILGKDNAAVRTAMQADRTLVNAADASGATALMRAAYAGTIEMVTALLDAGADVKSANARRSTALHWAVADPAKVRALLLAGADVNATTVDGRTALHIAALRSDGAPIVRSLLEAGANVDATTITGNTPLFSAASSSVDTARILLDHGANPNATSKTGATPLFVAALTSSGVVPLLIERGANVKAATKRGETALTFAALHGDIDAVRLLLDKGADVNSVDYRGYTPLMHAAYYDRATPALIRLLLDRGANVLVTGEGETPISIAAKRGENDVTRLLRDHAARSQPALAGADDVPAAQLRTAAEKALFLLEKVSPTFIEKGGCNSCHNQSLPVAAQAFARRRGVPTGEPIAQLADEGSETAAERFIEYAAPGGSGVSGLGYKLFARAFASHPADERVQAQIHYLKSVQDADGSWRPTSNRPPLTFDRFTSTAFVIHALNAFAPPADARDTAQRIDRARAWLMKSRPASTQERAFQLLGLVWSKADAAAMRTAVTALQATQRKDSGWSQLPSMPADAYATALSLYALYEGGVPVTSVSYQAGLRFLLDTQAADGTWHVKGRSLPIQPYFESGYPYGHDQWISSAAAAYATFAIAAAMPQEQPTGKP